MKNSNINNYIIKFWPQIFLILTIILGYWQIAFFQTTFKFDAIYNHLPWRFLIVDNLQHGHLPLWNYYHHLGTPIHADPQSGVWYPIVWLFSLFGTYDLYTYNFEFVFHVVIAGLGMQYLGKTIDLSKYSQFLVSLAYVFSGFYASNSMFLTWVISAAWIPFIIAQHIILLRKPNLFNSIILALFVFMLISGGYPAFTIVLIYILLIISGLLLFRTWKINRVLAGNQLIFLGIALVISILLSSVVLISTLSVLAYMPRGEPLSLIAASIPPFLPKHLLSLILPYPFVELNYDQTVLFDGSNIYFGLLGFALFILAIFQIEKKKKDFILLFIGSVFFLIVSFGLITPLYSLAFKYIPGFNYFRFPTLFRYFSIFGFLIIVGKEFDRIIYSNQWKNLKNSLLLLLIFLFSIFFISILKNQIFNRLGQTSLYDFVIGFNFWDKVFLQSIFQIFIVLLLILSILYIKNHKKRLQAFLIISFIELVIAFNIYMPYTISSLKVNVVESNNLLHKNINDFSLENNQNILENSINPDSLYLFSHFLFIYQKRIGDKGNTFKLKNFKKLKTNKSKIYDSLINNSVFYFEGNSLGNIQLLNFNYNSITIETNNLQKDSLVFLQNYYPGWHVKINDKISPLLKLEDNFMIIALNSGKNVITFSYEPLSVFIALFISVFSLIGCFIFLIIKIIKKNDNELF